MKAIWDWLNGNKTLLGTLLLTVTPILFGDHTFVFQLFMWLGGLLAGGGVVHKLAKGKNNT